MSKVTKAPRCLRLLAQHGIAALRPSFELGKYRKPMISPRVAAVVRKRSIIEGTFGSFSTQYGGWKPEWDKPEKMFMLMPHKGHLRERTRPTRAAKITAAMKAMPERIRKYEQDIRDAKPKRDIMAFFKRRITEASKKSGPDIPYAKSVKKQPSKSKK